MVGVQFTTQEVHGAEVLEQDVVWDTDNIRRIWWGGARGGAWDVTLEVDVENAGVAASCCASRC